MDSRFYDKHFKRMQLIITFCVFCIITFGIFRRTPIQRLLKQISCSLQLLASISVDELSEVRVPDVMDIRPPKEGNATLICLRSKLNPDLFINKHDLMNK